MEGENITGLNCNDNNLTSLDVSNNPALVELGCNNNDLSAPALEALFGVLPLRQPADSAKIYCGYNPGYDNDPGNGERKTEKLTPPTEQSPQQKTGQCYPFDRLTQ